MVRWSVKSKLRKAGRFLALVAITKRALAYEAVFAALLCYGIAQWSIPAALVVAGAGGIAALEVRG
jgi:hypothetical protein